MTGRTESQRLPVGVWLSAGGAVALLLAVSARYGFHRDEPYFIVAGHNLDWGYVDQPLFIPLVARASETVLGVSPSALRILPALAVGLVAVRAGLIARRLGGGKFGSQCGITTESRQSQTPLGAVPLATTGHSRGEPPSVDLDPEFGGTPRRPSRLRP